MKRKALLSALFSLSLLALAATADAAPPRRAAGDDPHAAAAVLQFYRTYVNNMLTDNDVANTPLKHRHLTPQLVVEMQRMLDDEVGADPIVHAQDVSRGMLSTLAVRHVAADWYAVSYRFGEGDPETCIQVRIVRAGSGYRIDCIPPL
jgi:hypothetical protein